MRTSFTLLTSALLALLVALPVTGLAQRSGSGRGSTSHRGPFLTDSHNRNWRHDGHRRDYNRHHDRDWDHSRYSFSLNFGYPSYSYRYYGYPYGPYYYPYPYYYYYDPYYGYYGYYW